jgi:two-component system LytT family response regulator
LPEPDIEIVAMCADGAEAVSSIRELAPDLVFLDVRMPGLSGFDVIEEIGVERMPAVIFLTAYEQHALDAFRATPSAISPAADREKFAGRLHAPAATSRSETCCAVRLSSQRYSFARRERSQGMNRAVAFCCAGGNVHPHPDEIYWVEAATTDAAHPRLICCANRRNMEPLHGFRQIHRSCLVSIRRIRELLANDNGDYHAVLDNGTRLKVGRRYKDALFAALDAQA